MGDQKLMVFFKLFLKSNIEFLTPPKSSFGHTVRDKVTLSDAATFFDSSPEKTTCSEWNITKFQMKAVMISILVT